MTVSDTTFTNHADAEPPGPVPVTPTRFVFLDTEATGLDLHRHELTEVAWIARFEDGTEVERQFFCEHTLDGADEAALELTAYHERIAHQDRTPTSEWLPQFLEDARGAVIVGAVPDFDARQMQKACREQGLEATWDHHLLDVETLALPLIAPGPEAPRSLARTCEALGVPHDKDQAHGALYDAQQTKAVFDAVWALVAELRATGRPLPPPVARPQPPAPDEAIETVDALQQIGDERGPRDTDGDDTSDRSGSPTGQTPSPPQAPSGTRARLS
ncbi:MAG: 3'-5' exonuclease [Actinomycetota bacterium]|nr:3'-5' exonuclease [Actinomycetota bacterium]